MFSALDADGDAITALELWDGNGGGFLRINGVRQSSNTPIPVAPADLGGVSYVGESPGQDALFVRASDGFALGAWASWTITIMPNSAPIAAPASATQVVATGQTVQVSSLFSASDSDGDAITSYRFWDSNGGGRFELNGVSLAAAQWIEIGAANLANVVYRGGASQGSEQVWVQAYDGTAWSTSSATWTMQSQRTTNVLPVIAGPAAKNVGQSEWTQLTTFLGVSDADADTLARFEVRDNNTTAGSGVLWYSGANLAAGSVVVVNTNQLSNIWARGGANNGTDAMEIRAYDGIGWSGWKSFDLVTRLPNRAPVVTPAATLQGVGTGLTVAASSLVNVSDAEGDAMTKYQIWDPAGAGRFEFQNGTPLAAGQWVEVSAANFATMVYRGGATQGSESIWLQASDGTAWSGSATWTMRSTARPTSCR
jgi:hypothetical protein